MLLTGKMLAGPASGLRDVWSEVRNKEILVVGDLEIEKWGDERSHRIIIAVGSQEAVKKIQLYPTKI